MSTTTQSQATPTDIAEPPSVAPLASGEASIDPAVLEAIESALGHTFTNRAVLARALTHASVADSRVESNERLEFLGDAILGAVVCHRIFERFPRLLEGEMTKIKSHAVSRKACATIAKDLGLVEHLALGKGMQVHGRLPPSLAAAVLESVVAAVYLDAGYEAARDILVPLVDPIITGAATSGHHDNFKSVLQQHAQQNLGSTPSYRVLDEQGPDHAKCFQVAVTVADQVFEGEWAQSKKTAEQRAALAALRALNLVKDCPDNGVRMTRAKERKPAAD